MSCATACCQGLPNTAKPPAPCPLPLPPDESDFCLPFPRIEPALPIRIGYGPSNTSAITSAFQQPVRAPRTHTGPRRITMRPPPHAPRNVTRA